MKTVSIIRDRGQLTIPGKIRKIVDWVNPMSVVSIVVLNSEEIIIKPHSEDINWDDIWAGIEHARSFKGQGNGNLSKFVSEDRQNH